MMVTKRPDMIGNYWGNQFKKGHQTNYKTGISSYRKEVIKQKCCECGKFIEYNTKGLKRKSKQINLDAHHKDGNRYNNKRDNLKVMCRSCHMNLHIKQGDIVYKKGRTPWNKGKKGLQIAWNKGLTKETSEGLRTISKKMMGNKNGVDSWKNRRRYES